MKRHLLFLMPLLILVVSGCQPRSEGSLAQSQEVSALVIIPEWGLSKMVVAGKERDLSLGSKTLNYVRDSKATISFSADLLNGSTGCNIFSGSYQGKPDGTFQWEGGGGVTEMDCPGNLAQQEADFLKLLFQAKHWQVKGKVLLLSDGTATNQLHFVPYNPPALPLEETQWRLIYFTQSDRQTESAESALPDHFLDLKLQTGQAVGFSGCSTFQSKVTIQSDDHLTFQKPTTTEAACPDRASHQEEKFLGRLPQMTRYNIREKILSLSNTQGTLGLQFEGTGAFNE